MFVATFCGGRSLAVVSYSMHGALPLLIIRICNIRATEETKTGIGL